MQRVLLGNTGIQRRELGTDYLDLVLLHCMTNKKWNIKLRSVMEVLSEALGTGNCACRWLLKPRLRRSGRSGARAVG